MDFEALANLQWKYVFFFRHLLWGSKMDRRYSRYSRYTMCFSKALNLASKLDLPGLESWDPLKILGNLSRPRLGGFHLTPSKNARAFVQWKNIPDQGARWGFI